MIRFATVFGKWEAGERRAAAAGCVLLAAAGLTTACTDYKANASATSAIWTVRVTTDAAAVAGCRHIQHVDSRDPALGCGQTVQPTPEECLRFQVKRVGGDTLLVRGPAGEAYACAAEPAATATAAATPEPAATASAVPAPAPPASPSPTAFAPSPPAPTASPSSPPRPASPTVRLTSNHDDARGCVYLGDLSSADDCTGADQASGSCAEKALAAGGNLVLKEGGRAQTFACPSHP